MDSGFKDNPSSSMRGRIQGCLDGLSGIYDERVLGICFGAVEYLTADKTLLEALERTESAAFFVHGNVMPLER